MGIVDAADRPEERADDCDPAEALVAVAQLVVSGADFRRLTREATRATARTLNADRCEVLRLAPGGERLLRVASCDEDAAQDERSAVPSGVSSLAGYALLCGAPVVSRNLEDERRFGTVGAPRWEGPVSAVAAPIPARGEFGALVAYAGRRNAFDERHAVSAARTASLLGGALWRLDEQEELRHRAEEAERRSGASAEADETPPEHEDLGLTDRQLEVLGLMADGRSAKQMASELGLSIHTIHSHQRNLYRTLEVGSFAGALKCARELGLLEAPGASPENL